MNKVLIVTITTLLVAMNSTAGATEYCSDGSPNWAAVMNGEYHVSNNVWGSGTGVGRQCLDIDLESTYFKVTLSEHNSSSVASYPFIYKGYHWGGGTAIQYNPFPIQVSELETAPFTWTIDTTGAQGTWNAAFEAWFSPTGKTAPDGGAELMIWINYHGGAGPAGSKYATLDIGGYTWDVYFSVFSDWNYIAYKLTVPATEVSVDLKDFVHDALTRGFMNTTLYLDNMEAGFEIWRDGQGLTSLNFEASAEGGASPVNYPPVAFALVSPQNNRTLSSMIIPFKWLESVDPNKDPVEYILHIFGTDIDTTITGIDTTTYTFDGTNYLESYTYYTWNVQATDGIDTVSSTSQRTFRTPDLSGIDFNDQFPAQFYLGQNFPNPFNSWTSIEYSLPEADTVTLIVYDMNGREIAQPVQNKKQAAGNHKVGFDAINLSSGVYIYKLHTDSFIATKKMLLIK